MQPWKKFEYRVRDYFVKRGFKAHRVPVSGASSLIKSDVIAKKGGLVFRVDAKSTIGKGKIRLHRDAFEKIKTEAQSSEMPIVVFSFYLHRSLYAVLEKSRLKGWSGKFMEKETRAGESLGFKKGEVIEATENKGGIAFSFRGDSAKYAVVRLEDLIKFLES